MRRDVRRIGLLMIAALSSIAPASAQIEWTPYANNPVIDQSFDIESQAIYRPAVVKWDGKYHMWYPKLWQQSRWMAYAISDDGITWELADNAVLGPSGRANTFDQIDATYGSVILDNDTLRMWYAGLGNTQNGIGYAWSTNGYDWTKVPGKAGENSVLSPASDGTGASVLTLPAVVKYNGLYHMWYGRTRPVSSPFGYEMRLAYATSSDGVNWQVMTGAGTNGSVLDLGPADTFDEFLVQWPAAVHNGTQFEMWYQGVGTHPALGVVASIGCARSADGITWEKIPDPSSENGECFRTLGQPSVILDGDTYKMWYALSALDPNDDVVRYATSEKTETAVETNELPSFVGPLSIYPNPMSSQARVKFTLADSAPIALEVHDVLGRLVRQLDLGSRVAGDQSVTWDGRDASGAAVPSGAYVVSIQNLDSGLRSSGGIAHVLR